MRLIDADAFMDYLDGSWIRCWLDGGRDADDIISLVFDAPVIAPESLVKRGRWIKLAAHKGVEDHKCSLCRSECYVPTCMGEPMYSFCPNCGAWMEGDA